MIVQEDQVPGIRAVAVLDVVARSPQQQRRQRVDAHRIEQDTKDCKRTQRLVLGRGARERQICAASKCQRRARESHTRRRTGFEI